MLVIAPSKPPQQESQHWYDCDGNPAYEVRAQSGLMRPTTLADARKYGYVPSVTTVLSVLAKPALTTWLVEQGIMAALTLPRIEGESERDFLARIREDGKAQAKAAADEGTRIHNACEDHFCGRGTPARYREHVDGVLAELDRLFPGVTDWIAEDSFCHPLGFGGKVDLHSPSTGIVVDYKGKDGDFSDGKKLAYDQHWQLSAYNKGLDLPMSVCANIFVSRTHPGKVASHVWKVKDIEQGWQVFEGALLTWKRLRQYDPILKAA